MKSLKLTSLLVVAAMASNIFAMNVALADTETVSQAITGGSLTIAAPAGDTSLTGGAVSTTSQVVTGTVTTVTVSDTRGTGAGWTTSSTMTHIGLLGSSAQTRVTASSITTAEIAVTGTYNGQAAGTNILSTSVVPAGEFSAVVASVAGSGASTLPATLDVTAPDATTVSGVVVNGSGVATFNGLTLTFTADVDWTTSSVFKVRVDAFNYSDCVATPATLAAVNSASTTGVSLQSGAAYVFSAATSASRADLVATANAGMGSYTYDVGLSCTLHGNPMVGTYNSTITLSVA